MKEKKIKKTVRLTTEELGEAYAYLKYAIFEQIREIYRSSQDKDGLNQQVIAEKLGIDKAVVSKRLQGGSNLTLKSIAELFAAMNARLDVKGVRLDDVRAVSDEKVWSKSHDWLSLMETLKQRIWTEGGAETKSFALWHSYIDNTLTQPFAVNAVITDDQSSICEGEKSTHHMIRTHGDSSIITVH